MKKLIIIAAIIAFIPALAIAVEKPSSKETKKVMDYYNIGKGGGAVLVDYTLCQEMGKEEESKNECIRPFSGNDIKAGDEVYLWMNFMIPVDDTANIYLSYTRNNRIRRTQEIKLNSAFRYRTWKKIITDKAGQWTIQIFQELEDKDIDLGSITYAVKE
ncbi:MAG: hypothetical protein PVG39_28115 [Desulfobacteraceae bacterium]|jgi:hypothetical protein